MTEREAVFKEIDVFRIERLRELWIKEYLEWTEGSEECFVCGRTAQKYKLWNAGDWDNESFCPHCGFDSWVKKCNDFNFDMMVLL